MKKSRITMFVLTMVLAVGMIGSSVFAAADNSVAKDEDTTSRMQASNNVATMTWDKCFELLGQKWPDKNSFDYIITKVKAWDNSNVDTDKNGEDFTSKIGTSQDIMPNPNPGVKQDNSEKGVEFKVNVPVSTNGTTTGNTGDNARTGVKTKAGQVKSTFTFTRPGYYLYKIKEVNDGVAGVEYDNHTYYIAFYVANYTADKTKVESDTAGGGANEDGKGLYVHTITAWRSQETTGTNVQILEQIVIPKSVDPSFDNSNTYYLKVKMETEEDVTKANAAIAAGEEFYPSTKDENHTTTVPGDKVKVNSVAKGNYYWQKVTQEKVDQAIQRGEIGKTNRSNKENNGEDVGPNKLTINFWNESDTKGIELEKRVTGTLGDLKKEFEFEVEVAGLTQGTEYVVNADNGANLSNAKVKGLYDGTGENAGKKVVKFNTSGNDEFKSTDTSAANATSKTFSHKFKVVLKAKEKINIEGLPTGATYKVKEIASDHAGSYVITTDNTIEKDGKIVQNVVNDADDVTDNLEAVIAKVSDDTNGNKDTALSTELETVNATDGMVKITYTNHRDIETETGIPNFVWPVAAAGILALIALAVIRRRKNVATVNDFEF